MPNATSFDFDYALIPDADARSRLKTAVSEIRRLQGTGIDTLQIGRRLVDVQGIVLAGQARGHWSKFCRHELAISPNTATRLMKCFRVFGGVFGDVDATTAANLQRTALIELAGDYIPAELRRQVLELARGGTFVSMALVTELLDAHGLTRPTKRVAPIAGVSNRGLHKIRSAVRMALEQCPAADRGRLVRELQSLIAELASQAPELDTDQARQRRLRTRRLPALPAADESLLAAGVPG